MHVCCAAEEARERKLEMANPDSAMRSVRTSSRTRVLYGIGIAIVGGEASQLILWSHFVMSNIISRLSCGPLHDASKFC